MQRRKVEQPRVVNTPYSPKSKKKPWKLSTLIIATLAVPVLVTAFAFLMAKSTNKYRVRSSVGTQSGPKLSTTQQSDVQGSVRKISDKKPESKGTSESIGSGPDVNYHIIFSTGCSIFQDWQSFVFFFQAKAAQQPGTITRIVSGCKPEDVDTMKQVFKEQIAGMDTRFKLHFTPDYSRIKSGDEFKYFNKPYGVHHWLEHEIGFPDHVSKKDKDSIVVLLDPDQLIMRPFRDNDFSNTAWNFLDEGEKPRTRIEHGFPMGQEYGFHLQWKTKVNMTGFVKPEELPSPVDLMDANEAKKGYIVGPPYVATAADMYKITTKWTEFAIPVHDQYPFLLAEMFAYCLSAAHQRLSHQTAISFMVSDTGANDEGWIDYIDKFDETNVCSKHDPKDLPNVLHFCQRYALGDYFFGKYRLPKDFLTCEHPLLLEPPSNIAALHTGARFPDGTTQEYSKKEVIRNAFMLCYMIPAMNAAAEYFKKNHCGPEANFSKVYGYHK